MLNHIQAKFKTNNVAQRKAVQLTWLFHLVGDIHQPMHSTAMFTPKRFKGGDWGGNKIKIGSSNMHSKWDATTGVTTKLKTLSQRSKKYRANPLFKSVGAEAAADLSFENWLKESHSLASRKIYKAKIDGKETLSNMFANFEDEGAGNLKVKLSDTYKTGIKKVGKTRVVEAGYRSP